MLAAIIIIINSNSLIKRFNYKCNNSNYNTSLS
jgi:hypothetical protein